MTLQLGYMSAILPNEPFESVVATAASIGYQCVELMCWPIGAADRRYAGVTHIEVDGFGPDQANAVQEVLDRHGVAVSGLGYYPNPLSPDEEAARAAVSHLRKVIDAAAVLGVGRVNTFVGRDWTRSVDDNWPRFLTTWAPLVEHAEQRGVRIGIENCPMLFTADEWPGGKNLAYSPAIWRRMFQDIPSDHFGLNYDPSHLVWMQMDPTAPLREFGDRVFHVHAKDVRVDRAALAERGVLAHPNEWHEPKLPGLGEIDWGEFVSALCGCGYRGPVCVEVEDRYYEGSTESRLAALRQAHDYLRNFIPA